MSYHDEIAVLIPSLDPDEKLVKLVEELHHEFTHIIIVNDGSSEEYDSYYQEAQERFGCDIFTHYRNLGKGRSLKDAFNYILTSYPQLIGIVSVDSDGQHSVPDTIRVAEQLLKRPDALILGCRNFSEADIPFRSRFGNVMTRHVMGLLCGIHISDTQTGLRGFSRTLMAEFLDTKGERFEYEMNMLLDAKEQGIAMIEVPISTIYIEENATSHFNPLLDSLRIYAVFMKFMFSSLASFLIDILLFTICVYFTKDIVPEGYIILSTVTARIFSGIFNFAINRNNVFQSNTQIKHASLRYLIVWIAQLSLSAIFVTVFYQLWGFNESFIKVFVDTILFIISFKIQREWVFG